jgi:hypothetical protein
MIKAIRSAIAVFFLVFALSPLFVFAQSDGGKGSANPRESGFQLVSCTGVVDPRTGQGVECDYSQLIYTATRILRFVLYILSFIVLGMILYTGWQYLTAGGDSKKLGDAKKMVMPIVIGIFFIFAAYLIVYQVILKYLLAEEIGDVKKSDIINAGGNIPTSR